MRIGSIYVYRDPLTDRSMYVGSTQDGDTMRRHREHLKERRSIGPWLRSFIEPPIPIEIRRYRYESVRRLFDCENHFMRVLGTFLRGLNKRVAGDGPVGIKDESMAPAQRAAISRSLKGKSKSPEHIKNAAKAHREVGWSSHPEETKQKMRAAWIRRKARGEKGSVIAGLRGTHNRWHVARSVVNPNCSLCEVL